MGRQGETARASLRLSYQPKQATQTSIHIRSLHFTSLPSASKQSKQAKQDDGETAGSCGADARGGGFSIGLPSHSFPFPGSGGGRGEGIQRAEQADEAQVRRGAQHRAG